MGSDHTSRGSGTKNEQKNKVMKYYISGKNGLNEYLKQNEDELTRRSDFFL